MEFARSMKNVPINGTMMKAFGDAPYSFVTAVILAIAVSIGRITTLFSLFQQIKKDTNDVVQLRNLTNFRRRPQYRLEHLLLVLLPTGQSSQIPATRHADYLPLFLLAANW